MIEPVSCPSLADYEAVIERGIQTFADVAAALLSIRERRLYEERGYRNFAQYCEARWGWAKSTAYQQLAAAKFVEKVRLGGLPLPPGEKFVRPLPRPPADEHLAAWNEVIETAQERGLTATVVKQIVLRRQEQRRNRPEQPATPPLPRPRRGDRFDLLYADPP